MIVIGLTGWGDHDSIYLDKHRSKHKLHVYSRQFPIVEVDSSFYAMQPARNYNRWIAETPDNFSFVVKAYQGMTGHMRGEIPFNTPDEMFHVFKESIQPIVEANKLKTVLFQYPPWFECTKKSVDMLMYTKEKMGDIPCAIEFRHPSWFEVEVKEKTIQFLRNEKWIHTICDEPQTIEGSVPIITEATHRDLTLIRLHGRNIYGWKRQENWRAVRCLYRYSEKELQEWVSRIKLLQQHSKDICVLFNNNSGGDAADNAKKLMSLLGLSYGEDEPEQLSLL
jgi:uncharacterized protein YecE (DUF72 family)